MESSLDEVLARVGVPRTSYDEGDCFLTVVVRTQGRRPRLLAETLASLAAQTDRDVEVVLVRHRAAADDARAVDDVVAGVPSWLRAVLTVLDLDTGARGAPLNLGFEHGRGRYLAALDDDDVVSPDWVAAFRSLHAQGSGRVLRTNAWRQDVEATAVDGAVHARPVGEPQEAWPRDFQLLDHLLMNHTPNMTVAFPREVFHDLGERFDESLDTTEDWDFLLRVATLVGVTCGDAFTATYRWWVDGGSTHGQHADAEWQRNHDLVQRRLDDRVLLVPHGSVQRLQELVELPRVVIGQLTAERDELATRVADLEQRLARRRRELRQLRAEQSAPVDSPARRFGRRRD